MRRTPNHYRCAIAYTEGAHDPEIVKLCEWLSEQPGELLIVAHTVNQLTRSKMSARLINGGAPALSLRQLDDFRHRPPRTPKVLALWPTVRLLGSVEEWEPQAVAVAPWNLERIDLWRLARQPDDVLGGTTTATIELDPVVRAALNTLANLSNANNGLTSYNRTSAVQVFRTLRKGGYTWERNHVAAFMANAGWRLADADELGQLAIDIAAGKRLRGGDNVFRDDILEQWRKAAAENQ